MYRYNLEYWNTQWKYYEKRLVLLYEDLVDNVAGPPIPLSQKKMTFMGKGIIPFEDLLRIWQKK
eukprot:CAMPEP_0194300238 /NCGR_PEP_ID=MMETSP0169-20130528/61146_1 /TAXON_ID=218684 /ORGANISM="Corethron pennatum, Strain L29A3" /LENGTH=63 /DNA_ID=CAMNT_0039050387 /DNA_START=1091 /DNA_END=1282 /DNA_ORIENTATION=+